MCSRSLLFVSSFGSLFCWVCGFWGLFSLCVTFWLALVASGVYSIWGTLTRNMYLIWLLFVYILCVFEKDMVDKNSRIKWKIICSSNKNNRSHFYNVVLWLFTSFQSDNLIAIILFTIRCILIGHSVRNPFQVEYVQYDLHCEIGWPWNQQQFSVIFRREPSAKARLVTWGSLTMLNP